MTGKILIVDDVATNRRVLRAILEKDYYTICEATNGAEAIKIVDAQSPDLILLDVMMPIMGGIEACRALKANPKTANIPIIMVTAGGVSDDKTHGLEAGADDFLSKPIEQDVLFARVRNLLRVKSLLDELQLRKDVICDLPITTSTKDDNRVQELLMVASNTELAREWAKNLEPYGNYQIDLTASETEARTLASSAKYAAIIVGENLADAGIGLRLIANIRSEWNLRDTTILFVAQSGKECGLRALEFGSNDYMLAPFDPREMATRLRTQGRRRRYTMRLRDEVNRQLRLSVIDPLTELHNRRFFDDDIPKLLKRSEETQRPFALMMIDVDHFKNLNDQYGHGFGDAVLVEFANRVRESLRAADRIVRFGGEEFIVISPNLTEKAAQNVAQRIRKIISDAPFLTSNGEKLQVTVSIGVTMVTPGERDIQAILKRADQALYLAKDSGRNQVQFSAAK